MTTPGQRSAADRKSRLFKRAANFLDHASGFLKSLAVVVALAVFALGVLLLWGVLHGPPVAAPFTRVGGASRVETALEASRFWLTPPRYVVETETHSGNLMLQAARCAVAHDAPLLFTSSDPKQNGQVKGTIKDWEKIENSKSVTLKRITISEYNGKQVTSINGRKEKECAPKRQPAYIRNLSMLPSLSTLPSLIRLKYVRHSPTLAPFVVFAAAIEPGHPPDVAVGLALAAHMARTNREKVSLVVVPHYLESDHGLEQELKGQNEPVTGGVVLGQTPTVPEETRELLRQLLTARDGSGWLAQLQQDLGSVGSLIAALLALGGLALVAAAPGAIDRLNLRLHNEGSKEVKKFDWLSGLARDQKVSIFLRSGRQVAGTIEAQIPAKPRDPTALKIKKDGTFSGGAVSDLEYVLVPVTDIEQIEVINPKPVP